MQNAVIYARYSDDKQTEQSIEGQLRVCKDYAERMGFRIVHDYIDRAFTGKIDDRPQFLKMIADSKKRQFDYVIVYKLDRFARNRYHSAIYKNKLKQNEVKVLSATEPIGDNPESILLEAMLEAHAEYFSLDLEQKVRRGMRESALKGNSVGGTTPLGYKIGADKKLHIDEETAPAVRLIYNMYAEGKSKRVIADTLNDKGYRTSKGQKFTLNSLTHLLKNRKYIGEYNYNGELTATCPAIIDKPTFDKVQAVTAANRRAPARSRKQEYLLTGKLYCGHCGKSMTGMSGRSATGATYYYYACTGRRRGAKKCNKKHEMQDFIEWYVVEQTQLWLTSDVIEELAEKVHDLYYKECGQSELDIERKRLSKVTTQINNVVNHIADTGSGALLDKLHELEIQKDDIETTIAELTITSNVKMTVEDVAKWLDRFIRGSLNDKSYQRKVIDSLVNAVYLYDDKVAIYYTLDSTKQVSYIDHVETMQGDIDKFAFSADWVTKTHQRRTTKAIERQAVYIIVGRD